MVVRSAVALHSLASNPSRSPELLGIPHAAAGAEARCRWGRRLRSNSVVAKDEAGYTGSDGTDKPGDERIWTGEGPCLGASSAAAASRSLKTEWLEAILLRERGKGGRGEILIDR